MTEALRLLTEAEAAETLQLCPRTLRKARQDGALPFHQFGRTIRYSAADIQRFIERARECPSTDAKVRRSGNTRSRSMVFDFEEARAAKAAAKRKS